LNKKFDYFWLIYSKYILLRKKELWKIQLPKK